MVGESGGLIDFDGLERLLLERAETLVPQWLPGGKRQGREYICADFSGGSGRSLSVNLDSGKWGDFALGVTGGDLLGLYAEIHGLDRVAAARELMGTLGMGVARAAHHRPGPPSGSPPRPPAPPPATATGKARPDNEGWRTVRPVPGNAPQASFKHHARLESDIEHVAEYRDDEGLQGYVVRFRTSDGGKDPLPRTWCESTGRGGTMWKWKQWDEPRPLYFPGQRRPAGRTVVLVEGEKKAAALHELLQAGAPDIYCVASWPGGSKAWRKADWSWLAGAHVLAWADCDAKHEPLTPAERKATPDKMAQQVLLQGKPLLSPEKQPGMAAMLGIGALLRDEHRCTVLLLPVPAPGEVKDGWDCGDAIAEGWDLERMLAFFGGAAPLPASGTDHTEERRASAGAESAGTAADLSAGAGSETGEENDPFQAHIDFICASAKCKAWELGVARKLVIAALNKAPALDGCLGYNELIGAPCAVTQWPWRDAPGVIAEVDDLRLGDWLSARYKLKAASRAALTEAIETVADGRRFHPIRDWLRGLTHDGRPRLERWLMHALGMDADQVPAAQQRYLALVGKYMLLGLVARVMTPGCKFDYSPVLEGPGGIGKSTFVKALVGELYFSDTHFDIGNGKDGMEQLEGLWAYELSEMTALRRADSEQVKQFFSSTVDRFRGAYGKYVQPHARQCLIFCTTNKRQYLYDLTGNRRFWPIWVGQRIRLAWLRKWREQLFAEALAAFEAGERYFPTEEEEAIYFVPEQAKRLVETAVQARLYELLTREGSPAGEAMRSEALNQLTTFVTLPQLCLALGADPSKSTAQLESQIRAWLDAYGWLAHRETGGSRRRGFRKPVMWPPPADEADADGTLGGAPEGAPESTTESRTGPARAEERWNDSDDEPF